MNSKTIVMTLAASSVLFAGAALAGEIYKYTDDDGHVAYVDRPTMDPNRVHMAIRSRPTDNTAVQANSQARLDVAREKSAADTKKAEEQKLTRSEKRATDAARQQQCQMDRAQLDSIEGRSRLYREGENGEREYLDNEASQAARDELRVFIQENCG